MRHGGQIHLIGVLSGFEGTVNPWPFIAKSVRLNGLYVGSRATFERMNRAFALHRIKPVIDQVFDFAQSREAFARLESKAHVGKIVVRVA